MRVIIAGSRLTENADEQVAEAMKAAEFDVTEVVCGEGGNVDKAGRRWAEARQIPVKPFPADWSQGKGAGPARNRKMAGYAFGMDDEAKAFGDGGLVALWDGRSTGTSNMIAHASVCGLQIYTVLV